MVFATTSTQRYRGVSALTFVGSSTEPLYYRAAVASKIEKTAEGEYKLDGFWTMKLSGGEAVTLRQAGGKWELLVPVNLSGGKAVLTQNYMW